VLGFEPMTYESESECAIPLHHSAPQYVYIRLAMRIAYQYKCCGAYAYRQNVLSYLVIYHNIFSSSLKLPKGNLIIKCLILNMGGL